MAMGQEEEGKEETMVGRKETNTRTNKNERKEQMH
jgi:hypothetical protein